MPDRVIEQVDVDPPREGVGDHQRRRGEIVRPHLLMHAALEVAVAGQHRGDDECAFLDGF